MTRSDRDPTLDRAIEELRRMPAVDQRAMQRVVEAASIARVTPADEPASGESLPMGSRSKWRAGATIAAMAVAAGIVGFVARGAWSSHGTELPGNRVVAASAESAASAASAAPVAHPLQAVADDRGVKPILHQFVFQSRRASRVSVVGDFNQWNPSSAPMVRSMDGALWSVLIPVLPGRHVFAFMVDDSVLTLDPTKPTARDPDLGTDASVVLVGRP